jgi:hypothetical protein
VAFKEWVVGGERVVGGEVVGRQKKYVNEGLEVTILLTTVVAPAALSV